MDSQVTRSRQRILESAVSLLRRDGLSGQLVQSAAAAARAPVSSANLFFQNDEELILAIYLRLAGDLQAHASALPEGGVAARFRALMTFKLNLVKPYREAFAGLFAKCWILARASAYSASTPSWFACALAPLLPGCPWSRRCAGQQTELIQGFTPLTWRCFSSGARTGRQN